MLEWHKPMTSKQAAKYLLTKGFVAAELHDAVQVEAVALRGKRDAAVVLLLETLDWLELPGAGVEERGVAARIRSFLQPNIRREP